MHGVALLTSPITWRPSIERPVLFRPARQMLRGVDEGSYRLQEVEGLLMSLNEVHGQSTRRTYKWAHK